MSRRSSKSRRLETEVRSAERAWPRWLGPWLLAGLFVALVCWSWRRWGDVFVDFGHELYIPWQLAEGRVLYRDIVYFMGPLSQYANAAFFTVFGHSLTTLIAVNLAILAGITAAIYRLFSRSLGHAAATLVGAVFLCIFAFAHYNRVGNYNYVTPYLHEQTHGVALALLLLVLLERLARRTSIAMVAAAGLTLGLTFLTKAEAFVPAAACAAAAGVLLYARHRPGAGRAALVGGVFVAAALVPVVAAFAFLAAQMPAADALRGIAGNWVYLFDRSLVLADTYYANAMGVAGLTGQLREMLGGDGGFARVRPRCAVAGTAAGAARTGGMSRGRRDRRRGPHRRHGLHDLEPQRPGTSPRGRGRVRSVPVARLAAPRRASASRVSSCSPSGRSYRWPRSER